MALTDAFLSTCRTLIESCAELTAFRAAKAVADTATRAQRIAAWHAAYSAGEGGISPALTLRKAIRDIVNAQADASGALGPLDREAAYATLHAQYVSVPRRPPTDAELNAAYTRLELEDRLS